VDADRERKAGMVEADVMGATPRASAIAIITDTHRAGRRKDVPADME
jgi:hypothetical protein